MRTADIRELQAGDFDLIAATDGGPAWNADRGLWNNYLLQQGRNERVVLVAIREQQIVAYGTLIWSSGYRPFRDAGIPEINNLVVASHARRRDIATRLIAELERRCHAAARMVVGIGVGLYSDYGPAQQLYVKLGYLPDGRGITHRGEPVRPGGSVLVDDGLVLWMTKNLQNIPPTPEVIPPRKGHC